MERSLCVAGLLATSLALAAAAPTSVTLAASFDSELGCAGGVAGGANIALTVPAGGQNLTFVYDPTTHVVTSSADSLGAVYSPASTTFGLWSPDSADVSVTVGGVTRALAATAGGVYQAVVAGDLKNQAYQFKVRGVNVRDPYARMVNPGTTQGIVVGDVLPAPAAGRRLPRWPTGPTR